jgi:biotin operon repressor
MNDRETVLAAMRQGYKCQPDICQATGLPEKRVRSAINNLRYEGRIEAESHQSAGRHKGRMHSIYREKLEKPRSARVSDVFALGAMYANQ